MNWENYGSYWHIDHKIPISVFNFEKPEDYDFKRCWNLKNLQPLEKFKNMSKGNRLDKHFQPSLAI
jgi:5-methylcytosine-specific restriction endonuclease McrA